MSEIKASPSGQKNNKMLPDAIIIHSHGIIRFINPAGMRLFGFSSVEEAIGKEVDEFVRPEDREIVQKRIRQIEEEEIFQSPLTKMQLLHRNGSVLNVEVTAVCAQYKGAPAVMSIVIDRAVKEEIPPESSVEKGIVHRKTEEDIRTAVQKSRGFEKLLESMTEGAAMYDAKGKVLWVNPAHTALFAGDMTGLTWEEWSGQFKQMLFHYPDGWRLTQEEYPAVRTLRGDDFSDEILCFNNLNNVNKIVSVCGRPLIDDGEIIGALVAMLDITRQEELIHTGKAFLQKRMDILDSIDDGLLSLDRAWRISYANRRVVKVLGLKEDDIGSKSIWEKYPRLIDSEIGNHIRQAMESNISCRFEFNSDITKKRYLAMVYPAAFGISVYIIKIK